MKLPILYSFRRCPYAIRARLAILASDFVCESREVALANKPAELVLASPKATIPVMVLPNGMVLEESLDIMMHVLTHNDPLGWLEGLNPQSKAMIATNDAAFKTHLDGYKYPNQHADDPTQHRQAGLEILIALDAQLKELGSLAGPDWSLPDIAILPFVRQFAAVNEDWFAVQAIPNVQTWLATFLASPLFKAAMVTTPIWQTGNPLTLFPATL